MTINELRSKRAKAWESAKAFLESRRNDKGVLSAEDDAAYARMENDIAELGKEIARMERLEALDAEMSKPVSSPITEKPASAKVDTKVGRAADEYGKVFWNKMRGRMNADVNNILSVGTDTEGGFLVPDTFEKHLITTLNDTFIIRKLAHTFNTSSGTHKIPVVATRGVANWVEENGTIPDSDDGFAQKTIGAHKLCALIKVSKELLNDAAFDLESHFQKEFAYRIGNAEEVAFVTGDGEGKPTGLLNAVDGAEIGVTTKSATAITAEEIMDLYHNLRAPYRSNAVWILNDATVAAIRKLKDNNGQFMWQPGLREGQPDTILGRPVYTSIAMPTIDAGAKTILFGDLSYYWIGDREGVEFTRLNELYADKGQVGFLATKRVDAKLILPEAVKVLQQGGSAT